MNPRRPFVLPHFAFAALIVLVGTIFSTGFAAHNGNNRASFESYDGIAIVNYRSGSGTFNGSIRVGGLEPGVSYSFAVRTPGPTTIICEGEANGGGVFSCSAGDLALGGFTFAVLSGPNGELETVPFARRGNCRDPNQGGTQCEAPGHQTP